MTKFKRLVALAAVSMLGIQLMGVGTAFAAGESECDFGSDNLEVTIDEKDVAILVDDEGILQCDDDFNGTFNAVTDSLPLGSVDSITVEMDSDDSTGDLTILLDDDHGDAAEWADFDTFDIMVTTPLYIDGTGVGDGAANRLNVKFGADTFSFSGTSGTYETTKIYFDGGDMKDSFDASKAAVKVDADGGAEDDVLKGGAGNDYISDNDCEDGDVAYGNGGNDYIDVSACDDSEAWGGEGHDDLSAGVVAPGAGNDDVCAEFVIYYGDLTGGVEWVDGETSGAAGDDDIDGTCVDMDGGTAVLSSHDDLFADLGWVVSAGSGDDTVKTDVAAKGGAGDDYIAQYGDSEDDNAFYGNAGNDILRGKQGNDELRGGPGSDQAWGGDGSDTCNAEVENRCELAYT